MEKERIEQIFGQAATSGKTVETGQIVVRPQVSFHDTRGAEIGWNKEVDLVRVWIAEVNGDAWVSGKGIVICGCGHNPAVYSDTFRKHEDPLDDQLISMPVGAIVQAGITIEMLSGRRFVTVAIGLVPNPVRCGRLVDNMATGTSRIRTNSAEITIEGVVQLSPDDAALVSRIRHEIKIHGEEHVRAVLELVTEAIYK